MARIALRDFAHQNGFNMVSQVRVNANGYLFVTLLSRTNPNHTENIYFSKRFQEEGGYKPGQDLRKDELFITEADNSKGEPRLKLTDKNTSAEDTLKSMGYQEL